MKNKLFVLLSLMTMLMLVSLVSATDPTVAMLTPVSSGTVASSSALLNATVSYAANNNTVYNVSFNALCSNTANSTEVNITTMLNHNASQGFANTTFTSTILEDSASCTFGVDVINGTQKTSATDSTTIIVDNTVPSTPSGLTVSNTEDNLGVGAWTATVGGSSTTGCTLYITSLGATNTYSMTHSSNTCTYASLDLNNGVQTQWYVQATDGTNTTNSATSTVTPTSGGGSGVVLQQVEQAQQVQQTKSNNTNKMIFVAIAALVLWLFLKK